ncbi:Uncharacterised protein [Mycobacteroides abscessus subsp. abscessus]|nr:Uncharacterised protein [Mycobacteroides abscessus subsp. abscessus]
MPAEDIEPGQPREAAESAPARPKGATVSIPLSTIGWSVALAVAPARPTSAAPSRSPPITPSARPR